MSDPMRRAVERHLAASTPLIEEVGLLGPLDGCVALVVPGAAALTAQQVILPRSRLSELLHAAARLSSDAQMDAKLEEVRRIRSS